jgi:hypothetical protein
VQHGGSTGKEGLGQQRGRRYSHKAEPRMYLISEDCRCCQLERESLVRKGKEPDKERPTQVHRYHGRESSVLMGVSYGL